MTLTPEEIERLRKTGREARVKSRGLGDTIAKLTKAVGIEPCGGCKKRQDVLNRVFPYKTR